MISEFIAYKRILQMLKSSLTENITSIVRGELGDRGLWPADHYWQLVCDFGQIPLSPLLCIKQIGQDI